MRHRSRWARSRHSRQHGTRLELKACDRSKRPKPDLRQEGSHCSAASPKRSLIAPCSIIRRPECRDALRSYRLVGHGTIADPSGFTDFVMSSDVETKPKTNLPRIPKAIDRLCCFRRTVEKKTERWAAKSHPISTMRGGPTKVHRQIDPR